MKDKTKFTTSWEIVNATSMLNLSSSEVRVLMCYGRHVNAKKNDGIVWISRKRVGFFSNLSERQVDRINGTLKAKGYITPNGFATIGTVRYKLKIARIQREAAQREKDYD